MKRIFLTIILLCVFASLVGFAPMNEVSANNEVGVKSYYLIDYDSGTVLSKYNEDEKRPIASIVKIMTLVLTFNAIDEGHLDMNQKILVSERASGMGGSQMFLDANKEYLVKDLIKGVVVSSANDAAVALGETINGSVEDFVQHMNDYAKELGMNNTLFCNTTGLPGGEQYSTARDVSIMTRKLLGNKDYYQFSKIWMEDYTHPDGRVTEMVNTNKLIRFYKGCDSGKTGFTNDAMFCLSASASRNDMRVVATVLGGSNGKVRFSKVSELFNYAFANYKQKVIFKAGESITSNINIMKSKQEDVEVYSENDVKVFSSKKDKVNASVQISLKKNLKAPLKADTIIGTIEALDVDGKVLSTSNIRLKNDVRKQSYLDSIRSILKKWELK